MEVSQGCPWDAGPSVGSRPVADSEHDWAPPWLSVLVCKTRMTDGGSRAAVSVSRWIYAHAPNSS